MNPNPNDNERAVKRGQNGELEVFPATRRMGWDGLTSVAFTVLCSWLLLFATPTTFIRSQAPRSSARPRWLMSSAPPPGFPNGQPSREGEIR